MDAVTKKQRRKNMVLGLALAALALGLTALIVLMRLREGGHF